MSYKFIDLIFPKLLLKIISEQFNRKKKLLRYLYYHYNIFIKILNLFKTIFQLK